MNNEVRTNIDETEALQVATVLAKLVGAMSVVTEGDRMGETLLGITGEAKDALLHVFNYNTTVYLSLPVISVLRRK